MIEKDSAIPLYEQIRKELLKELNSGQFKPGDCFYSLNDIVEMFGVSQITARRVLQDMAEASLIKTSRGKKPVVQEFVQTGVAGRIAILFTSVNTEGLFNYREMPWAGNVLQGIQKRLMTEDATWTMLALKNDKTGIFCFDKIVSEYDAFICLTPILGSVLLPSLRKCRKPFVTINRIDDYELNYVTADYYGGASEIAAYASGRHYRNYLYLTTAGAGSDCKLRGFMESLFRHGVDPADLYIRSCASIRSYDAAQVFEKFLQEQEDELFPLAVFAYGDTALAGVMEICRKRCLAVPGQVGMAGSTGIPEASSYEPPLTVCETPMHKIGETAVGMLGKMLRNQMNSLPGITFKTKFIDRGSL
ncbi:GntR family transcriptional regulator [Lentisphaerota bacterium ZTH]|nr:GntR family transcriptional regulator [Lentisphaerota bacterium]WET07464.1 GntR family transcriptional regulator [Lentisphaerota bacterium ZTH]